MSDPKDPSKDILAFPMSFENGGWQDDMTLQEYAAIKLKVPNSGLKWLDDMITEPLRMELAGRAMEGMVARSGMEGDVFSKKTIANHALEYANALIEEGNRNPRKEAGDE